MSQPCSNTFFTITSLHSFTFFMKCFLLLVYIYTVGTFTLDTRVWLKSWITRDQFEGVRFARPTDAQHPTSIMVLQRPRRHLVAIVVKPTDLPTHEMSQHNILHTPSAHSTGSRTHEPNSCQSTTFLTHSTTTIAKAYSCMHYSRCTAS